MSLVENKTYASDQGHFYTPSGEPAYFVPYKDKKRVGEMRPTTIKDCKELGLYPSVTTIMKVMSKGDALTNWVKRQVALAAEKCGSLDGETSEEWVEYVLRKAEENMTAQRDKGSRDHGIVEEYFREMSLTSEPGFVNELYANSAPVRAVLKAFHDLGIFGELVDSEKSFACDLGYGGKIDIAIPNPRNRMIVDFKFVDRLNKKKDYPEKIAQGAAYLYLRWGNAGLSDGRFANIFVSTDTYEYEVREWAYEEIQHGWDVFESCLRLWKAINKYDPAKIS